VNSPEEWMAQALRLAEAGRYSSHPNPRVGCVIVKHGKLVGEGAHIKAGEPHAEVHALRAAGEQARGATAYVTLEPCAHTGRTPPCVDALIAAGVAEVHAAMTDPNPQVAGAGLSRLQLAGIKTSVGLRQAEAEKLNRGFLMRMRAQRPFVSLKLAASLDARTAMGNGESQWITGAAARADVHRLRADAGAVLTSSSTVLADNPSLTVRDFQEPGMRQPARVVLDSHARVQATARVWSEGARRIWLTSRPASAPNGVECMPVETGQSGTISLPKALALLGQQQINHVLVECGPVLAGAFLTSGLVDEMVLYLAPSLLGHEARALAALPGLQHLSQRIELQFTDVAMVGRDLRITAKPRDS
jgi:diaminohydroxyphosphoribosylaminopyrimidine deaminase / 5-amino-6-(5-phosphoribosylamino)uracil reductase